MSTQADPAGRAAPAEAHRVPTATNKSLLVDGSDHALRGVIYDLFVVGERLTEIRSYLGRQLGITGPQFNLLTAVHQIEGDTGVSVSDVSDVLCVSAPFVTTESGKLVKMGLLEKQPDPHDARVTRLRLTAAGNAALASIIPEMQKVNDLFFGSNDAAQFEALRQSLDRLSEGGSEAVAYIRGNQQVTQMSSSLQARRRAMHSGAGT
jgi:MarR family transcriptional regulator, organic hydroperoxide resistance regulator